MLCCLLRMCRNFPATHLSTCPYNLQAFCPSRQSGKSTFKKYTTGQRVILWPPVEFSMQSELTPTIATIGLFLPPQPHPCSRKIMEIHQHWWHGHKCQANSSFPWVSQQTDLVSCSLHLGEIWSTSGEYRRTQGIGENGGSPTPSHPKYSRLISSYEPPADVSSKITLAAYQLLCFSIIWKIFPTSLIFTFK